jgi:Tol biopolymer transport system component
MGFAKHASGLNSRRAIIVVAAASLAALVAAGSALSTSRGKNGLILYHQQVNEKEQLFTVRPDGTGRRQLTHGPTHSLNAAWSADGKTIVFEHIAADDSRAAVATMNADGSNLRDLTPTGYQGDPSFTPDGRQIVFTRGSESYDSVWVMNTDGSEQRELIATRNLIHDGKCGCNVDATVSPDGKTVTFVRITQDQVKQALFAIGIDGTGLRQLTPYSLEVAIKHDWSADGRLVVFTAPGDPLPGKSANVYVMRPDGSHRVALTHYKGGLKQAYAGSFAPDGKWIVIRVEDAKGFHLARIRRNGTGLRVISNSRQPQRSSAWGTYR